MRHETIIHALGGSRALADELGCKERKVRGWRERDSIPSKHWPAVIRASSRLGFRVSLEMLADAVDRRAA